MSARLQSQLRRSQGVLLPILSTGLVAVLVLLTPGSAAGKPNPAMASPHLVKGQTLQPRSTRFVLPIKNYRLTGRFGDAGSNWGHGHTGLDFAAPTGTAIRAIAAGVVISAEYDGAYGNKTVVRLANGTDIWFAHQTRFAVSVGEHLHPGQLLGYVGTTGNVTGSHVHVEVRPGGGDPVDPYSWLIQHGLRP